MENIPNYNFQEIIGVGSFGKVYKAQNVRGDFFAIKSIDFPNEKILEYIKQEIEIMKSIHDENIVYLHEVYQTPSKIFLIMEYCEGGDAEKYLNVHGPFHQNTVKRLSKSLLQGLIALERMKIMHRDIKLSNLYLTDSNITKAKIKIGDFGFAKFIRNKIAMSQIGTPLYMAPEVFNSCPYNFKADVWSLGMAIYEMLAGTPVFECYTLVELFSKQKLPIVYPDSMDEDAIVMISAMLRYNS